MISPLRQRPAPGSTTARVWEIADEMVRAAGGLPSGRAVVDRYMAEGGNEGTGFTQFSHWKKHFVAKARPSLPRGAGATQPRIAPDGHLTLSPAHLAGMGVGPGDQLKVQVADGVLTLTKAPDWLTEMQALVRRLDPGGRSWVDELIAERRAEAARE
jgi:hypothetical protein